MAPRVFVLLVLDPTTGAATRPVGAVAVTETELVSSFVPYAEGADTWRDRLTGATAPPAETVAYWLDRADGITSAIQEVEPPAEDPRTAVEAVLDILLAGPDTREAETDGG
jgi:hypothetical protein